MSRFREGYDFFAKNVGNNYGMAKGSQYIDSVELEIDSLIRNLNSFQGYDTAIDKLKGDIAEFWHSGTHNIDAVAKGVGARSYVDRSQDFASADISTNWGEVYGSKYYKSAAESAKAQAKTYYERFISQKTIEVFEEFLKDRGYNDTEIQKILLNQHQTVYEGQTKIIPSDQLDDAITWLEQKIAKEKISRPDQVQRYQNVLDSLQDRIKSPEGSESIPLSKDMSENIAGAAKKGNVTAEGIEVNIENIMQYEYILKQSFKAGTTAATISVILRVTPEIFKAVEYLIENGDLDEKQFQRLGFAALQGGTEGFVRGAVSAAITTACKSGLWGSALKTLNPSIIGVATVVMMNTMQNAFCVVKGTMSRQELTDELIKDMFVSSCSLGMGIIGQGVIEIPIIGFMLGSFVGSMVGSFAYKTGYQAFLSFCIDTGFTMFGLVEQDYTLSDEILQEIGIDIFGYERFNYNSFAVEKFEYDVFHAEKFSHQTIEIAIVRRGLIGIRQVGYVC